MEVIMEFLQTLFTIIFAPVYILFIPMVAAFNDPEIGGTFVCIIVSVVYVVLCFLATVPGWKYEDTIAHCNYVRIWRLSGGWRFLHVIMKFVLIAIHVATYWTIWHGETLGLNSRSHITADLLCVGMTVAGLILSAWMVSSSNKHEAEYGPTRWSR